MKIINKDILTVDRGVIVQQVNCQGAMKSGVALGIRNKWPIVFEYFEKYFQLTPQYKLLGTIQFIQVEPKLYVVNLFGQDKFGYDGKRYTSYGAWEKALPEIKSMKEAKALALEPIYFPFLCGCDRGGGNWHIISAMIEEYFPDAIFCNFNPK